MTASKFPFPTVCADKQSTDWFHAIARTLKWNERERQKSFVVVEEGPARNRKKKEPSVASIPSTGETLVNEPVPDEEEDEDEEEAEEEEEEDKFDIDDSSAEAQSAKGSLSSSEPSPGLPPVNPKIRDDIISPPASGTGTPDRFQTTKPQPPPLAPRHLISDAAQRVLETEDDSAQPQTHRRLQPPPPVSTSSDQRSPQRQLEMQLRGEDGERDFIRAPESLMQSNKSKIPKDRDIEADSMRTPRPEASGHHHNARLPKSGLTPTVDADRAPATAVPQPHPHSAWVHSQVLPRSPHAHSHRNHRRHGSVDSLPAARRAFAAWGRDESDSNASDSDS